MFSVPSSGRLRPLYSLETSMKVVIFRPGSARRRTVFENQLLLYAHLQKEHGWAFAIAVDRESYEEDARFNWIILDRAQWASFRGRRWFFGKSHKIRGLLDVCRGADAILTVDPTVYPQSHLAFEVGRRLDLPVWFDATITLQTEKLFNRWTLHAYRKVRAELDSCDRIFMPSPKVVERFAHLRLASHCVVNKMRLLGHAIDTEQFKPSRHVPLKSDFRTILCVSRLLPEKGIAYILEAFLMIAGDFPDTRIMFLGSGEMEGYIQSRTPREILGTRVIISPVVPHSELPDHFRSAFAYVAHALETPRWEEYFGIANLEAMACGVPTILSHSGAIPWAVRSPAQPIWTAERDVTELQQHLRHVLTMSASERERTALANRQYVVENYSVAAVAQRFIDAVSPHE